MMKRIENINNHQIRNPRHQICNKDSNKKRIESLDINCKRKSDKTMNYSHKKSVFEGDLQTTVLKKKT